mmetsp:Transcript_15647/g.33797  ORF Transcript_15647/g.33797 Transcript_15647/m.33797 type:complete len:127 (-) Transcript_15647:895-1275(-)
MKGKIARAATLNIIEISLMTANERCNFVNKFFSVLLIHRLDIVSVVVSSPEPELYVIGNECTIHSNKYHCTLEKIHTLSSEKGEKHSVNWRRRHSKTLSPQTPLLPPTCSKTMKSTTKASSPSISS